MTSGFSDAEKAAMKERAEELRSAKSPVKGAAKRARDLTAALDKIAEMPEPDRSLAENLHRIITEAAPELDPRTWYGMPAYALEGKVLCFVQVGSKFESRYTTLGFSDTAKLDDGPLWATSFAVASIGEEEAAAITALIHTAVGH